VTARRGILGGRKVLERYPLTDDGWARAWAAFARRDPATAEKTRAVLATRRAARRADGMLAVLPGLVLTATDPPADGFAVGQDSSAGQGLRPDAGVLVRGGLVPGALPALA
jgi:hypothetical protein